MGTATALPPFCAPDDMLLGDLHLYKHRLIGKRAHNMKTPLLQEDNNVPV